MKHRIPSLLLAVIMLSFSCHGCKSSTGLQTVTVQEAAHTVFYAPFYVALEKGYFKDEGLKIDLKTGAGSRLVMKSLQEGDCSIALMGPETCIYAYRDEAEDYIVSFAQLTQRAGDCLVSRILNEKFTWDNLPGKTVIGGSPDSLQQLVFEYILKKHGMKPKTDLNIITDIAFGETARAFSSGQGDYTLEFEPTAMALEKAGCGIIVASLGAESGRVPYTVIATNKSYAGKHPEILQGMANAMQKGLDYIHSHKPEETARVIKPSFSDTTKDDLVKILEIYYQQDTWKENLIFEKGSYTLLQDILIDAGQLKSEVPYETVVLTEYAQKAIE